MPLKQYNDAVIGGIYAVIGGSHGGSLVKALEKTGRQVTDLTEKGLRMTAEAVTKLILQRTKRDQGCCLGGGMMASIILRVR